MSDLDAAIKCVEGLKSSQRGEEWNAALTKASQQLEMLRNERRGDTDDVEIPEGKTFAEHLRETAKEEGLVDEEDGEA